MIAEEELVTELTQLQVKAQETFATATEVIDMLKQQRDKLVAFIEYEEALTNDRDTRSRITTFLKKQRNMVKPKHVEDTEIVKSVYRSEFAKNWEKMINKLSKALKTQMVEDIRIWRIGNGPDDINTHTWRGVAELFVEKYPEFSAKHNLHSGNQISGILLCEASMKKLNETAKDGWN